MYIIPSIEDFNKFVKDTIHISNNKSSDSNLIKDIDIIFDKEKEGAKYNIICYKITMMILDKVKVVIQRDNTLNTFTKNFVLKSIDKSGDNIGKYVLNLDSDDAINIIKEIKKLVNIID